MDRLGKHIDRIVKHFLTSPTWNEFINRERGNHDIQPEIELRIDHKAASYLKRIGRSGVPVLQKSAPWTLEQKEAAIARGSHQSTEQHHDFLDNEMADMIDQKHWILIPYKYIRLHTHLRLSPMGVVPQRERRPRVIVDFTFSGVNQETVGVAPNQKPCSLDGHWKESFIRFFTPTASTDPYTS